MKTFTIDSMQAILYEYRAMAMVVAAAFCCGDAAHAQAPATGPAHATSTGSGQAWPVKPIRVLVGAPAGGTSDILVRLVGAKLTESWEIGRAHV